MPGWQARAVSRKDAFVITIDTGAREPQGVFFPLDNGAIDDKPTSDLADIAMAKNYVVQALTEAMAGKPVSEPTSRPYGCTVKYASGTQ